MRLFVASRWCDSRTRRDAGVSCRTGRRAIQMARTNRDRQRVAAYQRREDQEIRVAPRHRGENSPPNAPRWLPEPLRHKEIDHGRRKRNPPAQKPDRKTRAQQSDASIASDDREDRARRADAAAASTLGDPAVYRQQGAQREHPRTYLCQVRRLSGTQSDRRESDRRRARPRLRRQSIASGTLSRIRRGYRNPTRRIAQCHA